MSTEPRTCACNCGNDLDANVNGHRKYITGHRQRAYRERVKRAMRASGLPVAPSLKVAEAGRPTNNRIGDGPRPVKPRRAARPSDVRPTFERVYAVLVEELGDPVVARDVAMRSLTDKERALVEELGL